MISISNNIQHSFLWKRLSTTFTHSLEKDQNVAQYAEKIFLSQKNLCQCIYGVVVEKNQMEATLFYIYHLKSSSSLIIKMIELVDCLIIKRTLFNSKQVVYPSRYELMIKGKGEMLDFEKWVQMPIEGLHNKTHQDICLIPFKSKMTIKIKEVSPIYQNAFRNYFKSCNKLSEIAALEISEMEQIFSRLFLFDPLVLLEKAMRNQLRKKLKILACKIEKFQCSALGMDIFDNGRWYLKSISFDKDKNTYDENDRIFFPSTRRNEAKKRNSLKEATPALSLKSKRMSSICILDSVLNGPAGKLGFQVLMMPSGGFCSFYSLLLRRIRPLSLIPEDLNLLKREALFLQKESRNNPRRFHHLSRTRIVDILKGELNCRIPCVLVKIIEEYYGRYGHLPICPTLEQEDHT